MTVQTLEILIYNGRTVRMTSEPLYSFLENITEEPHLFPVSSGCWRGYVGTWLIEDNKLYLVDIKGYARKNPDSIEPIGLDFIFPGKTKVFAYWFTGEIRIPEGDLITNFQGEEIIINELEKLLDFRNGQLVGERMVDNLLELSGMTL